MTTAIIVQARQTSTRLPGKVMATVMGRPLLAYLIERLQRVKLADVLVIATTTNAVDDPIAELAALRDCHVTRGSELDVLDRYWQAARETDADVIVRVTADCPLIDPAPVDQCIARFLQGDADYLAYMGAADGMGFETFNRRVLETMAWEAHEPEAREHVTWAIYTHPERWRLVGVEAPVDRAHVRWTVDTPEDLELVRRILTALYPTNPDFNTEDIAAVVAQHPEWSEINRHVEQRYSQMNTELYHRLRSLVGNPWLAR